MRVLRIVRADDDRTPLVDRERAIQKIDERINFRPTRERPAYVMKKRGVYVSNSFDPQGNPVVYGIRADGRAIPYALPWLEGDTLEELETLVGERLDQLDPPAIPSRVVSFALNDDLIEAR